MSYYHEWNDGEPITRTKINNIEKGVRQANSILDTLFVPTALAKSINIFDGTQYGYQSVTSAHGTDYELYYGGYSTVKVLGSTARREAAYISLGQMELRHDKIYTMLAYTEDGRINIPIYVVAGAGSGYTSFNTNDEAVVYSPKNDIHDAFVDFYFEDDENHSLVPITGTYTILICEDDCAHTYDELVVRLNKFTDMYNSAYSHSLITDEALKTEMFSKTRFQNETISYENTNIELSTEGLHGVNINITSLPGNSLTYISRAMLDFDKNKTYTMYVYTVNGSNNISFGLYDNARGYLVQTINDTYASTYPNNLYIFKPKEDVSNGFLTIWSQDTITGPVQNTYYIYICEGEFTTNSFFGQVPEHTHPNINNLIKDLQCSAASRSRISNEALKADIFEGTQYEDIYNGNLHITRGGINAIKLDGMLTVEEGHDGAVSWISRAAMTFDANKTYTMYVETNDGASNISFGLYSGPWWILVNGSNASTLPGRLYTFSPDADASNTFITIWSSETVDVTGTYYIYICEGTFTEKTFFGNIKDISISDDELYVKQEIHNNNLFGEYRYSQVGCYIETPEHVTTANVMINKKDKCGIVLDGIVSPNHSAWVTPARLNLNKDTTYTIAIISPDTIGKNRMTFWIQGTAIDYLENNQTPVWPLKDEITQRQIKGENYDLEDTENYKELSNLSFYVNNGILVFKPIINLTNAYFNIYIENNSATEDADVSGTYYIYLVEGEYINENFFNVDNPVQEIVPTSYRKTNIYDDNYYTGLPILYLNGDFKNVTKDTQKNISYFYRDRLTSYQGTGTVKWQGSSSLRYPKKNFTIKLNNSISFPDWGSRNKFVLKANYIDASHARNVCCAKLWGQIVKSRAQYNSSDIYSSDITDTYLRDLPNGGAIDGFPIMLYINDSYAGLYTLNTSKDKKLFGINSNNEATACILSAEDHTPATSFQVTTTKEQVSAGTTFGVEYVYDANGNDKYDENEIEAAVNSLNTLLSSCNPSASMGDTPDLTTIANYIDIDSAIDYLLFTALIGGIDIWDKNYLLVTFDGTKWFISAYDLDSVLGNHWTGAEYYAPNGHDELHDYPTCDYNYLTQYNNLFKIIKEQAESRIQDRFIELTENYGPMSEENILTVFSNFLKDIPLNLRIKEGELWPHIPGTDTNNLAQIMNWYRLRLPIIRQQVLHSNT